MGTVLETSPILPEDIDRVHGVLGEAAGHGDDLEEVLRAADQFIAARFLDGPKGPRPGCSCVFLDEYGYLRVLDVFFLEQVRDPLDNAFLGQSFGLDPSDQGENDGPVLGHPDRLAELGPIRRP